MALSFNGTGDFINETVAAVSGYPASCSGWFYPTQNSVAKVAFTVRSTDSNERLQVTQQSDGSGFKVVVRSGGTFSAEAGQAYSLNTWAHVCAVWESSSLLKISVNGATFSTVNPGATPGALNETGYQGGRISGAAPTSTYQGYACEQGIWNVVLTQEECVALSKGMSPKRIRPSSLVRYIRCIRSSKELKGNANTLTGTTVVPHPRII